MKNHGIVERLKTVNHGITNFLIFQLLLKLWNMEIIEAQLIGTSLSLNLHNERYMVHTVKPCSRISE